MPSTLTIDRTQRRAWWGGTELPLQPRMWDFLEYLARRPRVALPRERIVIGVWGDAAMDYGETAFYQCVSKIRKVLPGVIRTQRKMGYLLDCEVTEIAEGESDHVRW